ncbi:MAG: AI-2E family transporter, partial [Syntrophaceae bacterium]
MDQSVQKKILVVIMALLISAIFLTMIRAFIMAILLAGIFSAMSQPVYAHIERWTGGRQSLASLATLLLILLI